MRSIGLCRLRRSNHRSQRQFWANGRHNPEVGIVKSVFSSAARPRQCGSRKRATRAGGLKTCWTKPPGTAAPQLWGL